MFMQTLNNQIETYYYEIKNVVTNIELSGMVFKSNLNPNAPEFIPLHKQLTALSICQETQTVTDTADKATQMEEWSPSFMKRTKMRLQKFMRKPRLAKRKSKRNTKAEEQFHNCLVELN